MDALWSRPSHPMPSELLFLLYTRDAAHGWSLVPGLTNSTALIYPKPFVDDLISGLGFTCLVCLKGGSILACVCLHFHALLLSLELTYKEHSLLTTWTGFDLYSCLYILVFYIYIYIYQYTYRQSRRHLETIYPES
ncbi:hypothetical protein J3F83DRAFT_754071 [Trichoderma novae-zelandiae]